jgi:hypothetical protein
VITSIIAATIIITAKSWTRKSVEKLGEKESGDGVDELMGRI